MSVLSRIPQDERDAYLRHEIPSTTLAAKYNISVGYLYQVLPRPLKPKPSPKSALNQARRLYRMQLALTTSVSQAAKIAHCSTRTMFRYRKKALSTPT